jgi:hypothetical protein
MKSEPPTEKNPPKAEENKLVPARFERDVEEETETDFDPDAFADKIKDMVSGYGKTIPVPISSPAITSVVTKLVIKDRYYEIPLSSSKVQSMIKDVFELIESEDGELQFDGKRFALNDARIADYIDNMFFFIFGAKHVVKIDGRFQEEKMTA